MAQRINTKDGDSTRVATIARYKELRSLGLTNKAACQRINVKRITLYRWLKEMEKQNGAQRPDRQLDPNALPRGLNATQQPNDSTALPDLQRHGES